MVSWYLVTLNEGVVMKNSSGKVMTVFLVIFSILLVSSTAISIFLFQKEREFRKAAETDLEQIQSREAKAQTELQEAKKQIALLEEKNKEADEKINSLLDDLELEKGLREQLKAETQTLKDSLATEAQGKEQLRQELTRQLEESQERVKSIEAKLAEEMNRTKEFETLSSQLQEKVKQLENQASPQGASTPAADSRVGQVDLETIVVRPEDTGEGRILTIDDENEFVILNLGEKDGITTGLVMSIYHGDEYLGDVKVNRVQSEMSAADFIPPLSAKNVNKNDRVIRKQ